MRSVAASLWELGKVVLLAALVVVPLKAFVFQPFVVRGDSMEPNFMDGDYLIVDELSYRFRNPERGEVIVFHFPGDPSKQYVKRIIGLPGEAVEVKDGTITVRAAGGSFVLHESSYLPFRGETPGSASLSLGEREFFVLGDNRRFSSDSRAWGAVSRGEIIGRVLLRAFPLSAFASVAPPEYNEGT